MHTEPHPLATPPSSGGGPEEDQVLSVALAELRPGDLVLLEMQLPLLASHVEEARIGHVHLQILAILPTHTQQGEVERVN